MNGVTCFAKLYSRISLRHTISNRFDNAFSRKITRQYKSHGIFCFSFDEMKTYNKFWLVCYWIHSVQLYTHMATKKSWQNNPKNADWNNSSPNLRSNLYSIWHELIPFMLRCFFLIGWILKCWLEKTLVERKHVQHFNEQWHDWINKSKKYH